MHDVKRVATTTAVILFFAWLIDYVDRLVITLALPQIGVQFHLDKFEMGLVLTVFFIAYAVCQVPGGLLADKIGASRTMTVAMVCWSAFTAMTGLAWSYVSLLAIRFVFGVFEGIFPGASMKAISERTTPAQRMTANGVMLSSNQLGGAISPLIAAPAIALVGWQHSFFFVAVFGVVIAAVLWMFLPRPLPKEAREEESDRPARTVARVPAWRVLGSGTIWKFTAMFFGYDIVSWGLTSWVPSYLQIARHLSIVNSGILASIPGFCGCAGTLVGGVLFDRFFHDRLRWLIVPCMLVGAVFIYLMLSASTVGGFILFESAGVAVMSLSFMPIFGLPLRVIPPELAGSAGGMINFGGQAGGVVAPAVMGLLADRFGFQAAFGFLIAGALLAALVALWAPQRTDDFRSALRSLVPRREAVA